MQDFINEFMEDYFAECEEHLTSIRHQLLAMETFIDQATVDVEIVNRLFRSFHTLKGLSGMVGIQAAESLAHEMESYLRLLRDESCRLQSQGFDALMVGTQALEKVIQAAHQQAELPDIQGVLGQLQGVLTAIAKKATISNESVQVATTEPLILPEVRRWQFTFAPSPELTAKGVNVTVMRTRLQGIGEILESTPALSADNKVIFNFELSTSATEQDFQGWQQDGLSWTLLAGLPESSPLAIAPPLEIESELLAVLDAKIALPEATQTNGKSLPIMGAGGMVVRVDLGKLDELMRMVGDLVISRAKLEDNVRHLSQLSATDRRSLQEINLTIERQLRDLREGVMRVRLVPIGDAFAKMQFVVRDLLRESNKEVALEITGQDTEIDKFVVERMMDPLLHLVRNAISHGIESPAERQAKGKAPQGLICLRAKASAETVVLEIEDDGQGIDVEKVVARGQAQGLSVGQDKDGQYDALGILEILCGHGFSTKEAVDRVSGRGVGMAIVQHTVTELGGLLHLRTAKDQGTCYSIQLPLTLAIADALIITVGDQTFAIPQTSIREITDLDRTEITTFENNEIFSYRDQVLSLIHLRQHFHIDDIPAKSPQTYRIVIVGNDFNTVGVVVDRVVGLREIVIRPLSDPFVQVAGIAGATELGDGRVVLILDVSALMRSAAKVTNLSSESAYHPTKKSHANKKSNSKTRKTNVKSSPQT